MVREDGNGNVLVDVEVVEFAVCACTKLDRTRTWKMSRP